MPELDAEVWPLRMVEYMGKLPSALKAAQHFQFLVLFTRNKHKNIYQCKFNISEHKIRIQKYKNKTQK